MARYFFGEEYRNPYYSNAGKMATIMAYGKRRGGVYPVAEMTAYQTPAKEVPNFNFKNWRHNESASELFTHEPEQVEINTAFSHTKMRHTVPIMASYLHQKYGDLTISEDLSAHSSRLAEHAKKLNLPIKHYEDTESEDFEITNDYDFDDQEYETGYLPRHVKELSPEAISGAKKHYKELRGITKSKTDPVPEKRHMGPQFTQMQLPGMES